MLNALIFSNTVAWGILSCAWIKRGVLNFSIKLVIGALFLWNLLFLGTLLGYVVKR